MEEKSDRLRVFFKKIVNDSWLHKNYTRGESEFFLITTKQKSILNYRFNNSIDSFVCSIYIFQSEI